MSFVIKNKQFIKQKKKSNVSNINEEQCLKFGNTMVLESFHKSIKVVKAKC